RAQGADGRDKTITPLRHGLYKRAVSFAQRLAQLRNAVRQRNLFDEPTAPHLTQELVLVDQAVGIPDQQQQRVESLRSQTYRLAAAQQTPLARHQAKGPEFVSGLGKFSHAGSFPGSKSFSRIHLRFHEFRQKTSRISQDLYLCRCGYWP